MMMAMLSLPWGSYFYFIAFIVFSASRIFPNLIYCSMKIKSISCTFQTDNWLLLSRHPSLLATFFEHKGISSRGCEWMAEMKRKKSLSWWWIKMMNVVIYDFLWCTRTIPFQTVPPTKRKRMCTEGNIGWMGFLFKVSSVALILRGVRIYTAVLY